MYDLRFPGLGITLHNVKDGITVFGFEIKFYGIIIALGFLCAYLLVAKEAKRTGQNDENYLDYILCLIIPAILGARIYYVVFRWSEYFKKGKGFGQTLLDVINIRNGGLAIYGGVIAGILVAVFFCKKRKISFPLFFDTAVMGLLVGQIMGRWGNFFNREAFGEYTDSVFAMCIPVDFFKGNGSLNSLVSSGVITQKMAENLVTYDGVSWISVHPTFLYESLWNLALLILILAYRKHKKFDGELGLMYIWGYGLGRVWIEGLRSDSLMLPFVNMKVSQLIAAVCVLTASVILVKKRLDYVGGKTK
jgi:phosphatidylglycerol:prolipoprotein diacylglycerol transferase